MERIGTSTVALGHKLVDPSKGAVIATSKVIDFSSIEWSVKVTV